MKQVPLIFVLLIFNNEAFINLKQTNKKRLESINKIYTKKPKPADRVHINVFILM